ncbi:nitrate reductase [Clostridium carboxidivorans P7]|uniref:FAD-dependent pyridine nucleotide-disulphide oxidoreductase n=1 Tax=Clostridium carboxidivorans P7 TaxID=536227 RepID=C6PSJ1_9CLOT|nr:FAD-dependent oxidoreductase [Clostridium carboxidivorans]ADN94259.1 NAD-dependent oxidoreductase [Clostridium carboxidivorans P7]AKN30612.1 nitrate reductase [Clostridium carboxidivorans P7]EET87765.1 FAD-dependent pyridine nucleotide-disulphide oxidoreductase [Clostridium carboxidivorans P7]EFG86365.1 nitrate reductase, NADH oxidase subunit [Clostridium carboxidivorans P7]
MQYLIIGASAAGINAAKTLRNLDKDSEITIISKDDSVYSRCMLHRALDGSRTLKELSFIEEDFFEKYNINWIKNAAVSNIDIDNKKVLVEDKTSYKFDKLLIASGASSFIPPVKNLREAKGVYSLRNFEDVTAIENTLKNAKNVVILGAGLVGVDAVLGIMRKNIKISIVEMGDRLLPLQLDKKASSIYEKLLKEKNIDLFTSVKLEEVILNESGYAHKAVLSDSTTLDCDMIIVAAGVRPNINFIKDNMIKVEKGIVVDKYCKTNAPDIYAAGDVTFTAPIWPIAVKQGITAAFNMSGNNKDLTDNFGMKNSMNLLGLECVSLGNVNPPDNTYDVDIIEGQGIYKKIIHKDGIIYGALLIGDISYCGVLGELIKNKINIEHIHKNIFDIDYSDFYNVDLDGQYNYKLVSK